MARIKAANVSPQYDEFGYDSGLMMLFSAEHCIYPNLWLGWSKAEPHTLVVQQLPDGLENEYDESGNHLDEFVDLGSIDTNGLTDDEWAVKLARYLDRKEEAWYLC